MTKELIEQLSLSKRHKELSYVLEQRRSVLNKIGSQNAQIKEGAPLDEATLGKHDPWENDIRIARARDRLLASINRIKGKIYGFEEELIPLAEKRMGLVSTRKSLLDKIKEQVEAGYLSRDTLELRQEEFRKIAGEPGRNPDLKKAYKVLKERRSLQNTEFEEVQNGNK